MHAPPPIAAPRHAAIVTWSISRRAVIARCPMRRRRRCMTRVGGAGSGSVRSAPRGEVPPRPGEHDRAGLGVVAKGERRVLDLLDVACIEGIRLLRAIERHHRDAAAPLHLEMPVFHLSGVSDVLG